MHTDSSASSTWSASRSASEYTATLAMPSRRAVLMTRQAISPRLAIRIFLIMRCGRSERNVAVLAPRVVELLGGEHRQRAADAFPRLVRLDHVVDVAARAGDERVGELFLVLGLARGELRRVALLVAEDDLDRSLRPHHRDLGVRPGEVDVAAQVLRAHHVVGAAVRLAGDDGDLRHRALGVGEQQLGAVLDDAAVLLRGPGMKPGTSTKVITGMLKAS